jgi:hypothetical protein
LLNLFIGIQNHVSGRRSAGSRAKAGSSQQKDERNHREGHDALYHPLEVMLDNMRFYCAEGNRIMAEQSALNAAPLMHPRLSSVETKVNQTVTRSHDTLD